MRKSFFKKRCDKEDKRSVRRGHCCSVTGRGLCCSLESEFEICLGFGRIAGGETVGGRSGELKR